VFNDNVVELIQPGVLTDRLTEVLRDGARALLTQAVEAEVSEFLAATATGGSCDMGICPSARS
jgi:putative transposase